MTAENGNGELKQLLEIKHAYRKGVTSLEEELKAQLERDLADGKKRLKEKYLEAVVDTVFAESTPAPPKPEPVEAPAIVESEPKCPECGSPVDPSDKFCAECAFPLTEEVKDDAPVGTTSRKLRTRRR